MQFYTKHIIVLIIDKNIAIVKLIILNMIYAISDDLKPNSIQL